MNEQQRETLKIKIQEQLEKVEQEISELDANIQPIGPENSIGRVSRMDAIQNQSVAEAGLRSLRSKRNQLKRALERIDDPGFGVCTRCKQVIAPARLMYMPESTLCVSCAQVVR
jgi:DnaK suppressor protein